MADLAQCLPVAFIPEQLHPASVRNDVVYHLCRSATPGAQWMLPQILLADPLPSAGVASFSCASHGFFVISPMRIAIISADRNQHWTSRVPALGALLIRQWDHDPFLVIQKRRKESLTVFLLLLSV